jgi:hypothetical protein
MGHPCRAQYNDLGSLLHPASVVLVVKAQVPSYFKSLTLHKAHRPNWKQKFVIRQAPGEQNIILLNHCKHANITNFGQINSVSEISDYIALNVKSQ